MGSVPFGAVLKLVDLGFNTGPIGPFQMELLAVPKWSTYEVDPIWNRSQKKSHVNRWKRSKQGRLGNDTAIHCSSILINKRRLKRSNFKNFSTLLWKTKGMLTSMF